jgi:hypothetical protein
MYASARAAILDDIVARLSRVDPYFPFARQIRQAAKQPGRRIVARA